MKQNTPLNLQSVKAIADAYKTYTEISAKKIRTPNDDSEQSGLLQFLQEQLVANASELLGCWIAVRTEYEPLIAGYSALQRRAQPRIEQPVKEGQ